MGTNFHTALIANVSRWMAATVNAPSASLDQGITYLKNIIVSSTGVLSYSSGVLDWTGTINIWFNNSTGNAIKNTIASTSLSLSNGDLVYINLNETDGTAITMATTTITTSTGSNFIAYNRLVLGYVATSSMFYPVYLRNPL